MKTTYILKLNNKRKLSKLIQYGIHFIKIKYLDDICFLYVDEDNYQKLVQHSNIYNIELVKIKGLLKYQLLFKKNSIFLLSIIIGIMFVYLLSNIIFDVKIMSNNREIIDIINNELEKNNLVKYHFVKSFNEKEKIKNIILNNYKDKIEWLEIDRVGAKYYIHVLERVINKKDSIIKYRSVISKKNAIILEIKASSGQIVKKVHDYVNKGDTIISGYITKKDDVKGIVKAEGIVFGETWYTVKVILPRTYHQLIYTGNSYDRINFYFLNKKIKIFNKKSFDIEKEEEKIIIGNKLIPFSLSKSKVYEMKDDTLIYTYSDALEKGLQEAREKLINNLPSDSKILEQKKLKLYEEDSKIVIEVFFKVYENITDYIEIEGE